MKYAPFVPFNDQILTGKRRDELIESIKREFWYYGIMEPDDKKDVLIKYGGKEIARLERSLQNKECEELYQTLQNKFNKYFTLKLNKHLACYLILRLKQREKKVSQNM